MPIALVTGGAGFIGSHLVHGLLKEGWQVRVLDNFSTGKKENLAELKDGFEVVEGDLRDKSLLDRSLQGVKVVFHQAAFVSVPQSMQEPDECFDVNVRGTELLMQAAGKADVRRMVIASSSAVYGDADQFPLREELPTRCRSPYAASKSMDEILAGMYTRAFGLEIACLRYFNVFGPRQRPDSQYAAAIPLFINQCLKNKPMMIYGDGGQTRDLIYVEDVVRANIIASEHPNAPGKIFNVCTGRETRILDLVEELQELFPDTPSPVFTDPRPGDIYRSAGSPEKALSELGFQAETSLADGLKATVAWVRS
jgi:UDP-glucose 4-epimerase